MRGRFCLVGVVQSSNYRSSGKSTLSLAFVREGHGRVDGDRRGSILRGERMSEIITMVIFICGLIESNGCNGYRIWRRSRDLFHEGSLAVGSQRRKSLTFLWESRVRWTSAAVGEGSHRGGLEEDGGSRWRMWISGSLSLLIFRQSSSGPAMDRDEDTLASTRRRWWLWSSASSFHGERMTLHESMIHLSIQYSTEYGIVKNLGGEINWWWLLLRVFWFLDVG